LGFAQESINLFFMNTPQLAAGMAYHSPFEIEIPAPNGEEENARKIAGMQGIGVVECC